MTPLEVANALYEKLAAEYAVLRDMPIDEALRIFGMREEWLRARSLACVALGQAGGDVARAQIAAKTPTGRMYAAILKGD